MSRIILGFQNTTSQAGLFAPVPSASVLIHEREFQDSAGKVWLVQTWRLSDGSLTQRQVAVNPEHRPVLLPLSSLPLLPKNVTELAPPPRVDRRGVDRGDRDPRMPLTEADKASQPTGERRTAGGPLLSLFQEVKSMLLTPSGVVVAVVIVVAAGVALARGGK